MYKCKFCGTEVDERRTIGVMRGDEIDVLFYCDECGGLEPYEKRCRDEI